jgi:hypothetical protein
LIPFVNILYSNRLSFKFHHFCQLTFPTTTPQPLPVSRESPFPTVNYQLIELINSGATAPNTNHLSASSPLHTNGEIKREGAYTNFALPLINFRPFEREQKFFKKCLSFKFWFSFPAGCKVPCLVCVRADFKLQVVVYCLEFLRMFSACNTDVAFNQLSVM